MIENNSPLENFKDEYKMVLLRDKIRQNKTSINYKMKVMTQEEKSLLLKDLCARLPYEVKVTNGIHTITLAPCSDTSIIIKNEHIIPYLRPMSSMTEEEEKEYHSLCYSEWCSYKDGWDYHNTISSIDWLLEHHFDFRGLIERGLAIEVTEENNPYK